MILIDDRSGSKSLINYPPLSCPSLCSLTRLSSGNSQSADVAFCADSPSGPTMLGIEVKSIDDLVDSLSSGRLQGLSGQMDQMREDYSPGYRWLLIYGLYRPSPEPVITVDHKLSYQLQIFRDNKGKTDRKPGWYTKKLGTRPVPYAFIQAFLSGPALPLSGFQYDRVNSIEEAAKWIYVLYNTWSKPWDKHKSLKSLGSKIEKFKRSENGNDNEQSLGLVSASDTRLDRMTDNFKLKVNFANLFPGMGYERSVAAAKYFEGRSLEDMIQCSPSEWAQIEIDKGEGKRLIRLGYPIAERVCNRIKDRGE